MVGRTECGKTTFIQKLGINKLFSSEITDVFWVSRIVLSSEREDCIRDSFVDQKVHISYPHDLDDFNYLVENFTQDKSEYIENDIGENLQVNKLIIMDDVSGLADKSQKFSKFLTVSRKYGFSFVYVFHTIYPGRQNWEMILSQRHIFNFFPGSIHSNWILKTLSLFASRQKHTYLPNQQVWLNKLYFQISNPQEKQCLTIDTRNINELGPRKLRTRTVNGEEQTCYFNRIKSDTHFTTFYAKRTQSELIRFSIINHNSDFARVNKSLDFNQDSLLSNGQFEKELEQANTENFKNGKSFTNRSTTTKSTDV